MNISRGTLVESFLPSSSSSSSWLYTKPIVLPIFPLPRTHTLRQLAHRDESFLLLLSVMDLVLVMLSQLRLSVLRKCFTVFLWSWEKSHQIEGTSGRQLVIHLFYFFVSHFLCWLVVLFPFFLVLFDTDGVECSAPSLYPVSMCVFVYANVSISISQQKYEVKRTHKYKLWVFTHTHKYYVHREHVARIKHKYP